MVGAENRDNFTKETKRIIAQRVGYYCSCPFCHKATTKANPINVEAALNVGEASHIYAASPGGPRYNPNMSQEERKNANNGIWLCTECATIIDLDPVLYPASLLLKWKENAEMRASRNFAYKPDEIANLITEIDEVCCKARNFLNNYEKHRPYNDFDNMIIGWPCPELNNNCYNPIFRLNCQNNIKEKLKYCPQEKQEEFRREKEKIEDEYFRETQRKWKSEITPDIVNIVVKCKIFLGDNEQFRHYNFLEIGASTNYIAMGIAINRLEELKTLFKLR